ncbi:MAG: exodeoxyribonuclease VII large subunit [Coriobacteriia bacterium]|nr:exodeoxyribonuclease VII large subunit [Coriobacteriia bacterium]
MASAERALSVSDAMALAKGALEGVRVRVVGEVSELTDKPGYKAVYFSLKDGGAVMPCLMWRDAYAAAGVTIADGGLIEIAGFFTAYPAKGRLQFQVRRLVLAGEGVLRLQVADLARRLEAEGLMRDERKRPLPAFPARIGVVTSPRGKAVHDILRTLERRYPAAEVVIAGVQVEGEGAVAEIVRGIEAVSNAPGVDVLILGRGGGSYEDLMPFNSEAVARAVVASPVPVVTGIGHEPDTSIADMVADLRASTPTAAAEAVAPEAADMRRRLHSQQRLLGRALTHLVSAESHRLRLIEQRPVFRDPMTFLAGRMQALDSLADALGRALPASLARQTEAVEHVRRALGRLGVQLLGSHEARLGRFTERSVAAGRQLVLSAERDAAMAAARLDDLSPLAILGRGYAVCYGAEGAIVRSSAQVSPGERVRVRLGQGRLGCIVETTETEE